MSKTRQKSGGGRRHDRGEIVRLFAKREREGLSYRELSEHSGVPVSTLQWWSRKLRRRAGKEKSCEGRSEKVHFVEMGAPMTEGRASIEISLSNGRSLSLPQSFDIDEVRALVEVLEERC